MIRVRLEKLANEWHTLADAYPNESVARATLLHCCDGIDAIIAATPREPSEQEVENVKLCGEYIAAGRPQEQPSNAITVSRAALRSRLADALYGSHTAFPPANAYTEADEIIDALIAASPAAPQEQPRLYTRSEIQAAMLNWRDVDLDDVCEGGCTGSGVRAYGDTSTWRGGIGGQSLTCDVCDSCWGSGSKSKPWPSRRTQEQPRQGSEERRHYTRRQGTQKLLDDIQALRDQPRRFTAEERKAFALAIALLLRRLDFSEEYLIFRALLAESAPERVRAESTPEVKE